MPMHFYPNKNYSLIYMWIAIGVTCCLLVAGKRFIQPAFNRIIGDINLASFEKGFQDLQHPSGSEPLASRSELGDFGGRQDGCDLFLGEIRRYDGNQERILAAYNSQDIEGYPLQVAFVARDTIPGGEADSLPAPLDDLAGWELPPGIDQGDLYLVYLVILEDENSPRFNCPSLAPTPSP